MTQHHQTLYSAWFAARPQIIAAGLMIGLGMAAIGGYHGWHDEWMLGQFAGQTLAGMLVGLLAGLLFGINAAGGIWLIAWSRSNPRRQIANTSAPVALIIALKLSDNLIGFPQTICVLAIMAVPAVVISVAWITQVYRPKHDSA